MRKTQKEIFISYTGTSKHLRVWASHIHQVFITSKSIVNQDKRSTNLLIQYLLPPLEKPLQTQTDKPKPRSRPCKNLIKLLEKGKTNKKIYLEDDVVEEDSNKVEMIQVIV